MIHRPYDLSTALQSGHAVRAALIGAGDFGRGIASQSAKVPALRISAVVDTDREQARKAARLAGAGEKEIAVCESEREVRRAIERGQIVVTADASLLFDQEIDIIVEATGIPEAGALHASRAISSGKHVAMVTKEADAAVGPILKHLAERAGVVYTAVDGDQHGLLIGMVRWAREIGLDILCCGKALDGDLVVRAAPPAITRYGNLLEIPAAGMPCFQPTPEGEIAEILEERAHALGDTAGANPWDLVELTIAANATGLSPDTPRSHCPAAWQAEIPLALCPKELGGILRREGAIDCVQVLCAPHELGLQGGVFLVVAVEDEQSRRILLGGDTPNHPDSATALIAWPQHLQGIEAVHSILAAVLLKQATGAMEYLPRFDVVYRAREDLAAGTLIGNDHDPRLCAEIVPASPISPESPLPAGLAQGRRIVRDVAAHALITAEMVEARQESVLWDLRHQQDEQFLV